jgi:hypothetical protein
MKVIIAASRFKGVVIPPPNEWKWCVTQVVSLDGYGPDRVGRYWANRNQIPSAMLKNEADAFQYADCLLAFHDGMAGEVAHIIKAMKALGKKVHVVKIQPPC